MGRSYSPIVPMDKFKIYLKAFWGKGKKPTLLSMQQAGVGTSFEVYADAGQEQEVLDKLTAAFASRQIKPGTLTYDTEYRRFKGTLLAGGGAQQML
tara:strand:- start:754 stop:1041 length:288 start_codon:yes stop_codon:yes gene_type:complete